MLQAEVAEVALRCDPKDLAQFTGEAAQADNATAALRVFAFGPDFMVMVIRGEGGGQVARAVFDLRR